MPYQLGLDTGGTYTDAVLINDAQQVVASAKSLTTHADLIQGLRHVVDQVLSDSHQPISLVSLSTTLATNALVEGRGRAVCLILIGYSQQQMQRARLAEALAGDPYGLICGGHTAAGVPLSKLDVAALSTLTNSVAAEVDAFAVSSVFAVRNPEHEIQARDLIHRLTGKPVSCGHTLSSALDAPRRALTALLNARLIPLIRSLLDAADALLCERDITAPLMVVKGDGSLVCAEVARASPVETILSGPAASVIGAQFLCRQSQLLIADMGGTTTDIAILENGQPRLHPDGATVAGWRTMVSAIDVRTFGLGGDSAVLFDREQREFTVGPERVLPLSLLTQDYPALLDTLQQQLELPYGTTHCAQFALAHAVQPNDLSPQQLELWARIRDAPIALQELFGDQTLERALNKLVQRGVVIRAGFTPSDASHVVGDQCDWQRQGAVLGARLLMRYGEQNLGHPYASAEDFARAIQANVARLSALAMLDTVVSHEHRLHCRWVPGLSESQREMLASTFARNDHAAFTMQASLHYPIVGLGAPVNSYYPAAARLLNTECIIPAHAHVANALGAVVGIIRQQQTLSITPAGGNKVNVHLASGVQHFSNLEDAVQVAMQWAREQAYEKARIAGAIDIDVRIERHDNVVEDNGQRVFFECKIVATAIGRPGQRIR